MSDKAMKKALRNLLSHVDEITCRHEQTHRGGTIWTICEDCGCEWADDRGGFQPYQDAKEVTAARKTLASV
jgi:ribosomal protein L37AE/L43A